MLTAPQRMLFSLLLNPPDFKFFRLPSGATCDFALLRYNLAS